MAIAFRSFAGVGGGNTAGQVTMSAPSGLAEGDIVLFVALSGSGQPWESVEDSNGVAATEIGTHSASGALTCSFWWFRCPATVPTSFTGDRGGGGGQPLLVGWAFSGCVDTGTPFEDATRAEELTTAETTPDTSEITTTGADRMAVCLVGVDDDPDYSSGMPPSGWTDAGGFSDTGGSDARADAIYRSVASAGNVAAAVVGTLPGAEFWASMSLALIPADTGGGEETGAAALTGAGALTASGTPTRKGAAALSGTGALAVVGVARRYAAAALAGTGVLSAAGQVKRYGAATLTGTGALAVTGKARRYGAAALSGTGALSAAGKAKRYAAATLSGLGALAAAGVRRVFGAAALTGTGALTVTVDNVKTGAASLTGTGTLQAAGVCRRHGAATLTGAGVLAATGVCRRYGAAALAGAGVLTVTTEAAERPRAGGLWNVDDLLDDINRERRDEEDAVALVLALID